MKCSKCGKETRVVCLCGKCKDCDGMTEQQKEEEDFLAKSLSAFLRWR